MTNKKALIVDDSKLALFVLKKMLVEMGLEVDTTQSGEEALGYLVHKRPDIVFLDHTMPGMDGLQALKIIKENPDTASIPVMMYTSKEDQVYMSQARALGAVDVLPKQLKPSQLFKVLQKLHLLPSAEEPQPLSNGVVQIVPQDSEEELSKPRSEKEELAALVKDAETALEKESLKQFIDQEFERQHLRYKALIRQVSRRVETLVQNVSDNRGSLLNIFNVSRVALLLVGFGAIFYLFWTVGSDVRQVRQQIAELSEDEAARAFNIYAEMAAEERPERQIDGLLDALAVQANLNSQVPYGEPVIGEVAAQQILEWMLALNAARYNGVLDVQIYTGRFCLVANATGDFVLPDPASPVGECQVMESDLDLESEDSLGLVRLVREINRDSSNTFKVRLISQRRHSGLYEYPGMEAGVTAGQWNEAAQKNHKIEYIFR